MGAQGKIFISYRREDAPGDARGICDRLGRSFGEASVFMDVDKLLAGQRFDRELDKALSRCDVLIAVIGSRWMELLSQHASSGKRDFVRDEIAAALKRDIVVIPVMIGREAHMPSLPLSEDLPENIRELVLYQKHNITHETFSRDAAELIAAINSVLRDKRGARPWRATAVAGAIGLALIVGSLGYWIELIPRIEPGSKIDPRSFDKIGTTITNIASPDADRAANAAAESAKRKADEEEASRKAEKEARKKAADEEAGRKVEEDARKKAADEEASRKAAEDAKRQVEADAARKKAEEEAAGKRATADCDRLAASPFDLTRPSGVAGVDFAKIDAAAATAACNDAMLRYPEMARLVFQAGRAADAQRDAPRAADLYRAAIAKGSAVAMTNLGNLYDRGQGVALDTAEARKLYEKAAALDEVIAMNNLGFYYASGRGVVRDNGQARIWYEKAAALGNSNAMTQLGKQYEKGEGVAQDYSEARKWYEKAAALDNASATNSLADFYYYGRGVIQDNVEARKRYEKAAALGDPGAMYSLGYLYGYGIGVKRDYAEARGWYEKGAVLRSGPAMLELGRLYENGFGVAKDLREARQWYQKAADAGNEAAKAKLKNLE